MAGLKIEGDVDNVSEQQLGFIKGVIEKRGFKDAKVVFEPVGNAGDNYVANVKRIIIEDKSGGSFKMIAKVAPNLDALRLLMNTKLMFENEHIMYSKVLPKFEQLQKSTNVPPEDRLRFAGLYGSFEEAPNEVILLEDLKESGFEMLDKVKSLSNECVKSVLRNFAILHSLSFALKHKEPEVFEEYKNDLSDLWGQIFSQEETKQFFYHLETSALMLLESDIHKNTAKGIISTLMNVYTKLSKTNKDSKHSVVQQGDPWTNNIMFKFDEENKPQSVMIDYQISKVASPVCDLLYMIFNCTDYQTRKLHYADWIDYYHDELDKNLSTFGLKANLVYPRDQLDADLKRNSKMSLGQSIIFASTLMKKAEEAALLKEAIQTADMNELLNRTSSDQMNSESLALLKKTLEGLIDSHLELGFL